MLQKCILLIYLLGLSFELVWPVRSSFQAARVPRQKIHNRRHGRFSCQYIPQCFCGTSAAKKRIPRHLSLAAIFQDDVALRTLGLKGPGSEEEIKRAFKRKVVEMHPDRQQGGSSEQKDRRFRDVLEAYARLTGKAPPLRSESKGGWKPKSPAQSEAEAEQWYAKDASRARWSQETGYNPSDLESIWDEIGFNPYTGEYHAPKASSSDWQQEVDVQPPSTPFVTTPSSSSTAQPGVAKSAATSPRPAKSRPSSASDEDADVRMQIATYSILAIACVIAALVPNLFSGQNIQNRFRSAPPPAMQRSGPPPTIQRSMDLQKADAQKSDSQPTLPMPTGNEKTPMAYNTIQQPEDDWSVQDFEAREAAYIQRWVDQFGFRRGDLKLDPEIASKLKFRE